MPPFIINSMNSQKIRRLRFNNRPYLFLNIWVLLFKQEKDVNFQIVLILLILT